MSTSERIHVLVRAAILDDRHVLLAHAKGAANTFLPGGHIAFGERMAEALGRELSEELGLPGRIGSYLGAVEHWWGDDAVRQHEINHVFAVSLAGVRSSQCISSREPHLEFFWAPVAELAQHNLQPSPLIELLHPSCKRHRHQAAGPLGCAPR